MRKPAKLKVPVEPKMPERFYLAHNEWVLFDPDELAPGGDMITTGASLIESIQNFAEDFDVSLDDVQVYSDIGINNDWGGETYLHGNVRLRADCQRDRQVDAPEWYAKKLAWYEKRMVKYRAKMVEYETAKPIHEAKMAEYRAWKAARENQKELRLLRRLQKKYAAEIAREEAGVGLGLQFERQDHCDRSSCRGGYEECAGVCMSRDAM